MANKLKEYSGHHTMKKASPRPFVDDEAELNNYLEKNRYGGEGNHYNKDRAMPNPNRTRFTKFEENLKNSKRNLSLDDKAKLYFMGMIKAGLIDALPENPKAAFVQSMMDSELASILGDEEDPRNMGEASIEMSKNDFDPNKDYGEENTIKLKENFEPNELEDIGYSHGEAALMKISNKLFNEPYFNHYISGFMKGFKDNAEASQDYNASIQKESKMKKSDLLKDYMSSRKGTNLNEQMITHRKEAKRSILMEGAMKQFFELFEVGRTDEEIVLDYANKGVQVPEQFVSKARSQYEGLKKMKLELEMSEKEFKNSAKDIVNNPDEKVVNSENKPLSSGIYNEQ